MRTDCTRDNRKTFLPCASHLGFDLWNAKRGNWILYRESETSLRHARVIGGVTCERKRWIEVCAMLGNFDCPAIRWIEPQQVLNCRAAFPREILDFIAGEWKSPADIIARIEHGFMPQEWLNRSTGV